MRIHEAQAIYRLLSGFLQGIGNSSVLDFLLQRFALSVFCTSLIFFFFPFVQLQAQFFSAEQTYRAAMNAFKERNYYSARLLLAEISDKDSRGEYGDDAKYYTALAFYYENDYKTAIFEFKALQRDFPASEFVPRSVYWTGECWYYLKKYKTALEIHHGFVRKYKDHILVPNALYSAGYIYAELKRYDEAVGEFNRILKEHPESKIAGSAALQAGIALYNSGEYSGSRKQFQIVMVKYANAEYLGQAQFWIGKSYFGENKLKEAEIEFTRAIENYPGTDIASEALYYLSLTYYKAEKKETAGEKLKQLIKEYPAWKDISLARFRLAQLYFDQQNLDLAYTQLIECRKDQKGEYYLQALEMQGEILRLQKKVNEALQMYDDLLGNAETPTHVKKGILKKKADVLYLEKRFDESAAIYAKLQEEFPDDKKADDALLAAALSYQKQGLFEKARESLETLVKEYRDSSSVPEAWYLLGELEFARSAYAKALQYYARVIKKFPTHTRVYDARSGIGWSYFELKQFARAADIFRDIIKKYPNKKQKNKARLALSACLYNLRDFKAALKLYALIIKDKKESPEEAEEALFQAGWLHYRRQNYSGSEKNFREYRDSYPAGQRFMEAVYFQGWSLYRLGQLENALDCYIYVADKAPQDSIFREKAKIDKAKTLATVKKYQLAAGAFQDYLSAYPSSSGSEEAWYSLARTQLALQKPNLAEESYAGLKSLNATSAYIPDILRDLGDYYRRNKNYNKAREIYALIVVSPQKKSDYWDAKLAQAGILAEEGKFSEAIQALEKISGSTDEQAAEYAPRAILQVITLYHSAGKYQEGYAYSQTGLKKAGRNQSVALEIRIWQGRFLIALKKYDEARKRLGLLLKSKEVQMAARFFTAISFLEEKRYPEALDYFKQSAGKPEDPLSALAQRNIADIYFEQNQFEIAGREYARLVYIFNNDSELYEYSLFKAARSFKLAGKLNEFESYKTKLKEAFPQSRYLNGEIDK